MTKLLLGKPVAEALQSKAKGKTLNVVMVYPDDATKVYADRLKKLAEKIGSEVFVSNLSGMTQEQAWDYIYAMEDDPRVGGILIMKPLPQGWKLTTANDVEPATAHAVLEMMDYYNIEAQSKHIVIVGRSEVVGKPLAAMLTARNATVTLCHSHTVNLDEHLKMADIIVAAVGKPKFINVCKEGAVIIDVGINVVDGKIVGDVDFDAVNGIAAAVSSVPGGVGSVVPSCVLSRC